MKILQGRCRCQCRCFYRDADTEIFKWPKIVDTKAKPYPFLIKFLIQVENYSFYSLRKFIPFLILIQLPPRKGA